MPDPTLTREEIADLRNPTTTEPCAGWKLSRWYDARERILAALEHALSEPARIAAARAEGQQQFAADLDRYWQFSAHEDLPAVPTSADITNAILTRIETAAAKARAAGYREGVIAERVALLRIGIPAPLVEMPADDILSLIPSAPPAPEPITPEPTHD